MKKKAIMSLLTISIMIAGCAAKPVAEAEKEPEEITVEVVEPEETEETETVQDVKRYNIVLDMADYVTTDFIKIGDSTSTCTSILTDQIFSDVRDLMEFEDYKDFYENFTLSTEATELEEGKTVEITAVYPEDICDKYGIKFINVSRVYEYPGQ